MIISEIMSVDWQNFKYCLGGSGNTSVFYIDTEGNEIPIGNECEFQEAIRLAKSNNKRLKLILYCNKSNTPKTVLENQCKQSDIHLYASPQTAKTATMDSTVLKETKCHCDGDIPPEWFIHYMKKFKKEILSELKSSMNDAIHSAIEKEKKSKMRGDITDVICGKTNSNVALVTNQSKKKKKGSEKDLGELLEQREVKLAKKIDKLHPTKFDKLEKFDNKTRVLLEEKRKLLERKRHSKLRLEKNCGIMSVKEILKKSASFHKNEVCVFLPPNGEFVVTLNFTNDGILSWEAPWLECFDFNGLYPKEVRISLPRLLPGESGFITLRGRVSETGGLHHFKCRLFDGLEKFGPEFTCWAKVEVNDSEKKPTDDKVNCQESDEKKNEDSVGILIDFEKDEFTATRKKIAENINEIERRLLCIDFMKPLKNPIAREENIIQNTVEKKVEEEFHCNSSDLTQNLEVKEKNWKEKLEQEGVYFGIDCLRFANPNSETNGQKDENEKNEELEKLQANNDSESSSESELSIIFLSEEEENFIVVPLPSKSPSPAESVREDKKFMRSALEEVAALTEEQQLELQSNDVQEKDKEALDSQWQLGHLKSRRPPSEDVSKSKPKKIKPCSTEYHFTTTNMSQANFSQILDGLLEERPSKFTFTGEKEEEKRSPDCTVEKQCAKHTAPEKRKVNFLSSGCAFEGRPSTRISLKEKKPKDSPPNCLSKGRQTSISSKDKKLKDSPSICILQDPPEYIFLGNKIQKASSQCVSDGRPSKSTLTENKEEKSEKENVKRDGVATVDASGKIIYAVNSYGYCVSVEEMLKGRDHLRYSKDKTDGRKKESDRQKGEKRYDRFCEVPSVNGFPISIMNGASNVASLALNTAKSVINNLHSAFGTEGKVDLKKLHENREISARAMLKLLDMGFDNAELNKILLLTHENNVTKVVEDLIEMQQNGIF